MKSISRGSRPDLRIASVSARATVSPVSSTFLRCAPSLALANPRIRACIGAPRVRAASSSSIMSAAAPSARTRPARSRSNGRLASSGGPCQRESTPTDLKTERMNSERGASVAPAMTTSASPTVTWLAPQATASRPAAHAVENVVVCPRAPASIAT